jgi:hypothetical protein
MNQSKSAILGLIVLVAGCALAAEEPKELEAARAAYRQSVERATQPLKTKYLSDLGRLRETYTRAGKLNEALAVENEVRSLTGQSALPMAAVTSEAASKQTITISSREANGTALGPAKKGQRLRVQYVDGEWTTSGGAPVSPDSAPHAFAKVAVVGVVGGKEEVIMMLPNGTKQRPFTDDFKKDYDQVYLRVNDHTKDDNTGDVTYKATIK